VLIGCLPPGRVLMIGVPTRGAGWVTGGRKAGGIGTWIRRTGTGRTGR